MSTKKTTPKKSAAPKTTKAAPVKKAKKLPAIEDFLEQEEEDGEGEGTGKIAMILKLWIKGYSRKDIVAAGYNRSTVYRQVGDFEKMKKAPMTSYYGYDLYEGRILKIMAAKKVSRDKAVEMIASADIAG